MNDEEANAILLDAAGKLGEHFESVQILATDISEKGGTRFFSQGIGNWYARQGMAHEFINADHAADAAREIAAAIKKENEDE